MHNFDHCETDAAAALEAGQILQQQGQTPQLLQNSKIPFIINTNGEAKSIEHLLDKPTRFKARPIFGDAESFGKYVNIYKGPGALIFSRVGTEGGEFVAALDMAAQGDTSWNDHSASFKLEATPDWKAWTENNKKWMKQEEFVLFVETQRHVFVNPTSATMLEIAMSLEATVSGNYKSAFRSQNGDKTLVIDMTTDASFGKAEARIAVPQEFTIGISPFEGQNPYEQSAFLRFRPTPNGVVFQYELQRPEEAIRSSAEEARTRIASDTGLPVLNGSLKSKGSVIASE